MCGFDSCYPWLSKKNNKTIFKNDKKKKYFSYFFLNNKKCNSVKLLNSNKFKLNQFIFNFTKIKNNKKSNQFNFLSNNTFSIIRFYFYNFYFFTNFIKTNFINFLSSNLFSIILNVALIFSNNKFVFKFIDNFLFFNSNYLIFYKSYKILLNQLKPQKCIFSLNYFNKYRIKCKSLNLIKDLGHPRSNFFNKFSNFLNKTIRNYLYFKNQRTLYNYVNFSKIFFKSLTFFKKKFNRTPSFFFISNFDKITNTFLRLTKSTKFLPLFDFYINKNSSNSFLKKINKLNLSLNTLLSDSRFVNSSNKHNSVKQIADRIYTFNNKVSYFNFNDKVDIFNSKSFNLTSNVFFYFWNKIDFILTFFFKPLFFKFLFFYRNMINFTEKPLNLNYVNQWLNNYFNSFFFYNTQLSFNLTNLIPNNNFQYIIKKTVIKIFNFDKFSIINTPWYYHTLIKFLEFCSGKKVCLHLNGFLNNSLTFDEKIRCFMWSQRVKYFRKVLGPKLFLNESIQIMYLALKNKDPYLLSNWIVTTMYKISFWKYKTFLRYIKYVLRYFFWSVFTELNIRGIKFQLKGKISVAGNARTRTAFHYVGFTSHATFDNKILYNLSLVKSFTGVMGLKLWIVS